jgi:hypothetical protein
MNHTPTPWFVRNMSDTTTSKEAFCERYTIEVCSDGLRSVLADIREVNMCPEHGGTAEANAAYIVKAVNSHAALVSALSTILNANPDWEEELPDWYAQARAALAQAEEGTT